MKRSSFRVQRNEAILRYSPRRALTELRNGWIGAECRRALAKTYEKGNKFAMEFARHLSNLPRFSIMGSALNAIARLPRPKK